MMCVNSPDRYPDRISACHREAVSLVRVWAGLDTSYFAFTQALCVPCAEELCEACIRTGHPYAVAHVPDVPQVVE